MFVEQRMYTAHPHGKLNAWLKAYQEIGGPGSAGSTDGDAALARLAGFLGLASGAPTHLRVTRTHEGEELRIPGPRRSGVAKPGCWSRLLAGLGEDGRRPVEGPFSRTGGWKPCSTSPSSSPSCS